MECFLRGGFLDKPSVLLSRLSTPQTYLVMTMVISGVSSLLDARLIASLNAHYKITLLALQTCSIHVTNTRTKESYCKLSLVSSLDDSWHEMIHSEHGACQSQSMNIHALPLTGLQLMEPNSAKIFAHDA